MRNLKELANALGGEVSGGQVLAPGPGHSKRDRSLSVKPKGNGDILAYSHAGDSNVLQYARDKLGIVKESRSETVYTYRDETGAAVLEVVRKDNPKSFYQRSPN